MHVIEASTLLSCQVGQIKLITSSNNCDPSISPGSANQCILEDECLRSNLPSAGTYDTRKLLTNRREKLSLSHTAPFENTWRKLAVGLRQVHSVKSLPSAVPDIALGETLVCSNGRRRADTLMMTPWRLTEFAEVKASVHHCVSAWIRKPEALFDPLPALFDVGSLQCNACSEERSCT